MVVGVLHLVLVFHDCQSLKDKRGKIRQLTSRIKNKFEVAVAEVGAQDMWQRAEVGIASIGNDKSVVNMRLDHVINFIESQGVADLSDQQIELINM